LALVALLTLGLLAGCSSTPTKSADVSEAVRKSLDQAGFKDVSASQDREKGVVTLEGHVVNEGQKREAASIAQAIAVGQVVSNQIAVIPVGAEKDAKAVNSDLDAGIEKNLDAALIQNKIHEAVKYSVKNHVVTLTGEVDSQAKRANAEALAASVPNVQQVVNELQVKKQKATSTN
jgi:osmotically-inducible protein OsmY